MSFSHCKMKFAKASKRKTGEEKNLDQMHVAESQLTTHKDM
jgi:hypothetical protein